MSDEYNCDTVNLDAENGKLSESDQIAGDSEQTDDVITTKKRVSFPVGENLVSFFEIPAREDTASSDDSSEYDSDEDEVSSNDSSTDDTEESDTNDKKIIQVKKTEIRHKNTSLKCKSQHQSEKRENLAQSTKRQKDRLTSSNRLNSQAIRINNPQTHPKCAIKPLATKSINSSTKHKTPMGPNKNNDSSHRAAASKKSATVLTNTSKDTCAKCGRGIDKSASEKSKTTEQLDVSKSEQLYAWKMANGDIPFPQLVKPFIRPLWGTTPVHLCNDCFIKEPP